MVEHNCDVIIDRNNEKIIIAEVLNADQSQESVTILEGPIEATQRLLNYILFGKATSKTLS
jgi:hypothetical protein